MSMLDKPARAVLLGICVVALSGGCATTRQFIPTEEGNADPQRFRVYLARHRAMLSAAVPLDVRCNDLRVGVLGCGGYLSWLCDKNRHNVVTWGVSRPMRKAVLSNVSEDNIYLDISPTGGWAYRRLNAAEGQALVSGMSPPTVVGRGYSLLEDPSAGTQKGYVEFYEPDDDNLWSGFAAYRANAGRAKLRRTEVNAFPGSSWGVNEATLYVPQRLRYTAPTGPQNYVLTLGSWRTNLCVEVVGGHVTPVCVDIIPEAESTDVNQVGTLTTYKHIVTFKVDIDCQPAMEQSAYDRKLLCKP